MLSIRFAQWPDDCSSIQSIRRQVFQIEQGVPDGLDFDGQDAEAHHLLVLWHDRAIGTARWRYLDPHTLKLERVAVVSEFRGRGIGQRLMEWAIAQWQAQGIQTVKIHAQLPVVMFYQRLGFDPEGDMFEEAGILHQAMQKRLP